MRLYNIGAQDEANHVLACVLTLAGKMAHPCLVRPFWPYNTPDRTIPGTKWSFIDRAVLVSWLSTVKRRE